MLRGHFFGEKLNRQNGHYWLVDGGIIPPSPTPTGNILMEGIIYIVGGERVFTDGGRLNPLNMSTPYSVVEHNGRPFFYPHDQYPTGQVMSNMYDPAINVAGSVYASTAGGINPSLPVGQYLQYVNTVIYTDSFFKRLEGDAPEVIALNNYITEHGRANIYIRIKPNPNDPVYMQELEKNLCIGEHGEDVSDLSPVPAEGWVGEATTWSHFWVGFKGGVDGQARSIPCPVQTEYVVGSPEPVLLSATNGPDIPANTTPIRNLHGFRVGDGINLNSVDIAYYTTQPLQYIAVSTDGSYFSFPFDYENDASAPYLSLKVEVFYD